MSDPKVMIASAAMLSSVVVPAPGVRPTGNFGLSSALFGSKLGLAFVASTLVMLLSLAYEPPFLLTLEEDPMHERRVSYVGASMVSLGAGAIVLLFPGGSYATRLTPSPPP